MELKTLKDLRVYGSGFSLSGKKSKSFPYSMFREIDLKQSVIDDIKELEKPNSMDLKFAVIQGIRGFQKDFIEKEWDRGNQYVISWIKWKFNITEKDLK